MSDDFDFKDLTPVTKKVTNLGGRDYVLHEASTDAATRYKNKQFESANYEDGKLRRIEGRADADPLLLSCCITYDSGDEKGQLVPLKVVRQWPERVTKGMIQWVKEHSDLDDTEDPLKVALQEATAREDSPVTFDQLLDWVGRWSDESKEDKKLRPLYRLLEKTIEERAKNVPKATTANSE